MAEAIRNWFAYNKAIWLKRKFVVLTKKGKSAQDRRSCPTCGAKSLVLVSKKQAVLLCRKCEETHIKARLKKAATPRPHVQQALPEVVGKVEDCSHAALAKKAQAGDICLVCLVNEPKRNAKGGFFRGHQHCQHCIDRHNATVRAEQAEKNRQMLGIS